MTTKDEDGSLGAEVSSRLDELFGDDGSEETPVSSDVSDAVSMADGPKSSGKKSAKSSSDNLGEELDANSPIRNLKALVFSIDWEITDETMVDFLKETKSFSRNTKTIRYFPFSETPRIHRQIYQGQKARAIRMPFNLSHRFIKVSKKSCCRPKCRRIRKNSSFPLRLTNLRILSSGYSSVAALMNRLPTSGKRPRLHRRPEPLNCPWNPGKWSTILSSRSKRKSRRSSIPCAR